VQTDLARSYGVSQVTISRLAAPSPFDGAPTMADKLAPAAPARRFDARAARRTARRHPSRDPGIGKRPPRGAEKV
jgi:hypothetical protein